MVRRARGGFFGGDTPPEETPSGTEPAGSTTERSDGGFFGNTDTRVVTPDPVPEGTTENRADGGFFESPSVTTEFPDATPEGNTLQPEPGGLFKGATVEDGRLTPGPPGPRGPQGDRGPAGPQGPQGERGPMGNPGAAGSRGPIGPAGPQGMQGPQGPQGEQGDRGPRGPDGPTGPQGPIGPRGPDGPRGPQGMRGATGPQGPQGPAGAMGRQGDRGPAGPAGPMGNVGPIGPQGPIGMTGPQGATGLSGRRVFLYRVFNAGTNPSGFPTIDQGFDDQTGQASAVNGWSPIVPRPTDNQIVWQIATDIQLNRTTNRWESQEITSWGSTAVAISGVEGPQGDRGPAGPQGPMGNTGERGPMGLPGSQGMTGMTGPTGPAGPRAEYATPNINTGSPGDRATVSQTGTGTSADPYQLTFSVPQGPQGAQGDRGPQGIQGPRGEQGPIGMTGPQGQQGDQGPRGEMGPRGLLGPTGPQGEPGTQVVANPTGTSGDPLTRIRIGTTDFNIEGGGSDLVLDEGTTERPTNHRLAAEIDGVTYFIMAQTVGFSTSNYALGISNIADYTVFTPGQLNVTVAVAGGRADTDNNNPGISSVTLDGNPISPTPRPSVQFSFNRPYGSSLNNSHRLVATGSGLNVRTNPDGSTTDIASGNVSASESWNVYVPDYWVVGDRPTSRPSGNGVRPGAGATVRGTFNQLIYLVAASPPGMISDQNNNTYTVDNVGTFSEVDQGGTTRNYTVYEVAGIPMSGSVTFRRS